MTLPLNDTQRLDAIREYGLCLASHEVRTSGGWKSGWVVHYGEHVIVAPTIREAIDAAVLDLCTRNPSERRQ